MATPEEPEERGSSRGLNRSTIFRAGLPQIAGKMKAADEPAYLTVGTDVSAKYRGAFCEAKIKTVKRLVKVKVRATGTGPPADRKSTFLDFLNGETFWDDLCPD
ncbi:hypothetical protein PFLUV_G00113560 [Perca fluviatilis]|uniref:Uncharacterized protein n=1 Tax=Perca fluviatilis TaxID=8168 RepID=A0A6A5EA15_PERFL|nr:hypothetical protein PFLUV_G00113560 [Perca fluviatilis]